MHARSCYALLTAVALLAAQVATAEPLGRYFTITPFGGYTMWDGNFRYPKLYPLTDIVYAGGRLGYQHNSWLGLEAAAGFSPTKENATGTVASPSNPPTAAESDVLGGRDVDYWHVSGNLMVTPFSGRYASPFLFGGGGYSRFTLKTGSTQGATPLDQGNLEFGGGLNIWLTDAVGLRLEARDIEWFPGDKSIEKTQHIVLGGGITFALGGKGRDTDGDGVCDGVDRCPDTPRGAQVSVDGCPIEVIERETELLDTGMMRLQNVNFETGKSDIAPESYPVLDVVGQVLVKWPGLRVEVGGHTDSRGSEVKNQALSEARASSVLSYLTQKFPALQPGQYMVMGYGESKPIAPNTTPLNMAKNRRVEFVVINKDVLKREIQRRRLLQQGETPVETPKK